MAQLWLMVLNNIQVSSRLGTRLVPKRVIVDFNKTCIKDDYCTYDLKSPSLAQDVYDSDKSQLSTDKQGLDNAEVTFLN